MFYHLSIYHLVIIYVCVYLSSINLSLHLPLLPSFLFFLSPFLNPFLLLCLPPSLPSFSPSLPSSLPFISLCSFLPPLFSLPPALPFFLFLDQIFFLKKITSTKTLSWLYPISETGKPKTLNSVLCFPTVPSVRHTRGDGKGLSVTQ